MSLYCGNDSNIEVLGLTSEDGSFITDASLTCVITNPSNMTLATVTLSYRGAGVPVTVGGKTYLDGNYRGVLPGATALVAGTTYKLVYAASNYGFAMTHYEIAQARGG